ncbi:unnamed protein product [Rhodiola kirilowii]
MEGRPKVTTFIIFPILLNVLVLTLSSTDIDEVTRSHFPDGFLFGAASAAYQIEGAPFEDGKSLSNWDVFTHLPGSISDGSNGNIACDNYHHSLEDIELLDSLGVDAYRFSVSWSRILPRGSFGAVNSKGIEFYDRIINNLLRRGIVPFLTISHYDFPQELEDRFGAWLSPLMQDEYLKLVDVCFESFGDKVKHWITFNEPNMFITLGYLTGVYTPGRCSLPFGNCSSGNSFVEPLVAMHNMLLAHGKATMLYRKKYKEEQGGLVGITGNFNMYEPLTNSKSDLEAAQRSFAFDSLWVMDPLIFGDYPKEMRLFHGNNLPKFTQKETLFLKGSLDFIGLNHYTTSYVMDCSHLSAACSYIDANVAAGFLKQTTARDGVPIGGATAASLFWVVPRGMEEIVDFVKERYNNTPIFITENGYAGKAKEPVQDDLNDIERVDFMKSYLAALALSIRKGADVRGYFAWSLMDSFEWSFGYTLKFGLYHVDFKTQLRTPKLSAKWYSKFMAKKNCQYNHPRLIKQRIMINNNTKEGVVAALLIDPRRRLCPILCRKLFGLDTLNPILLIDNRLKLIGEYDETIGTCYVFSEQDAPHVVHEETGPSERGLISGACIVDPNQPTAKQVTPITSLHKIIRFRLFEDTDVVPGTAVTK